MTKGFHELCHYIHQLRSNEALRCPWTAAQTVERLIPQTQEELREFIEAYHSGDARAYQDELGDMLYHFAFYCVIAVESLPREQAKPFNERLAAFIDTTVTNMLDKHESRLPPASLRATLTPEELNAYWQAKKRQAASLHESPTDQRSKKDE